MSEKGTEVLLEMKTDVEDASKSHDGLSEEILLNPDIQCISNILENCISQIEFAAALPSILKFSCESSDVDKGLRRALEEHQALTERLETLEDLKGSNEDQEVKDEEERAQLKEDFQNSVRNLLRLVRTRPDVISDLRAEQKMQIGESESILITELNKFHGQMMDKLLTTVDHKLKPALFKHPTALTVNIERQEAKLAAYMKEIDEKISLQNIEIENLTGSLEEKNTEEANLSIVAGHHVRVPKKSRLQQETDQLQTQLNNLMLENREAERVIQKKNDQLEAEIEYLLQSFDTRIEEIQADLEVSQMNYKKDLEELKTLEIPFSVLEVEFNQIQEKHRLEEEKRKEEMKELELKTKAALYAQAWWRGYSTRKALKNKGKDKKAKKGKGKKTK
ncbi:dynein regulatory complex protein 9 [Xyrichtys novacula]|uniref:Dynein regulatory complex protein 10 n=1 Tax=Xyrichtys novacula TaxID=13765 RepID=A0AAV1G7L4_XYRNO|nr:dynein regulatory complex protein 9 [Xyrichtys novacula]